MRDLWRTRLLAETDREERRLERMMSADPEANRRLAHMRARRKATVDIADIDAPKDVIKPKTVRHVVRWYPHPHDGQERSLEREPPLEPEHGRHSRMSYGRTAHEKAQEVRDVRDALRPRSGRSRVLKPGERKSQKRLGEPSGEKVANAASRARRGIDKLRDVRSESRTFVALRSLLEQQPVPTDPNVRKKAKGHIGYPPPGMIRMSAYPAGKGKGLQGKGVDAEYPDTAEGRKIAKAQAWILPSKITKAGKKTYRF